LATARRKIDVRQMAREAMPSPPQPPPFPALCLLVPMLALEVIPAGFAAWWHTVTLPMGWSTLVFAGVISSGVAYTLQIIGQKGLNPTVASLLMSLESVFAVLAGWAILNEQLTSRELWGCGLIFAAVVLAQLPLAEQGE